MLSPPSRDQVQPATFSFTVAHHEKLHHVPPGTCHRPRYFRFLPAREVAAWNPSCAHESGVMPLSHRGRQQTATRHHCAERAQEAARGRFGKVNQGGGSPDRVEGSGPKRKRAHVALDERDAAGVPAGVREKRPREVQSDYMANHMADCVMPPDEETPRILPRTAPEIQQGSTRPGQREQLPEERGTSFCATAPPADERIRPGGIGRGGPHGSIRRSAARGHGLPEARSTFRILTSKMRSFPARG